MCVPEEKSMIWGFRISLQRRFFFNLQPFNWHDSIVHHVTVQPTYLSSLRRVQAGNVVSKSTASLLLLLLLFFCSCWGSRGFHVGLAIKHSNFFWSFNELQSSPLFSSNLRFATFSAGKKKKKKLCRTFSSKLSLVGGPKRKNWCSVLHFSVCWEKLEWASACCRLAGQLNWSDIVQIMAVC